MKEFLAENNACGQNILLLVSRGNAIIAELLRLKDYIPKVYRLESKQDIQIYGEIIQDFSYLKTSEAHERKIEESEVLRELDEEFRDNHIEIIKRFYLLFESIHSYIMDLNHYIEELEDGIYIHQSLETVFQDNEGKQLLCESLFLYGLMLIAIDAHIDGIIRERLLISYNRYTPQRRDTESSFDEVCKLLMDTGLNTSKKPQNYPEDYFKRVSINSNYIDMVIGRLRSDDIYSQISVFPLPKHRSTALATQASMLYICLFFSPTILHCESAVMREIVDKYFPDNWIISVYMGFIVNLAETWENFKSAKQALSNTLQVSNIKHFASNYGQKVPNLLKISSNLLKEGNITKDSLLKDINNIVNTLRECNVTLRWLILHTVLKPGTNDNRNKKLKLFRDLVTSESNCEQSYLFKLLLNTAQLELVTQDLYKSLMLEKDSQWEDLKRNSYESLIELSEVFSGSKPLSRIKKNSDLEGWFKEIAAQIENLSREDSGSSRKLVQLIQALEEVQEYHQLDNNMQVIQFLSETRSDLNQMIRTMSIKEDVMINLHLIGDISYAWELIDFYTQIMQNGIKKEPKLVIKLRAVFLKLASALELPLLRINQSHSEDLISVSQYYSKELEIYVRKVLQIIPSTMFEKLARIIEMQTRVIKEVPSRVDKDKLKDFAQLDERFEFAELTHSVSIFSQGMRMMKSTLVGVVCLDPKQLLEDGIRKELVQHVSKSLNSEFTFSSKPKQDELESKLKILGQIMDGYKRSFEYIQDYININGLKIWQEEVTRIVNYNVEQECNGFLRSKVHPWQSIYQSRYVPIPIYPPIDGSENFVGRLAREVIRLTDPRSSVFLPTTSTWYDIKVHKPIMNKETIACIAQAIEITGLVGLDRLFSFMIITALQRIIAHLENKNVKANSWSNVISAIHNDIKQKSLDEANNNPLKVYQTYINRTTKIWSEFLEKTLLIGQLQLLRNLIAFHLNKSCKFNAKNYEASLRTLNKSLLLDLKQNNPMPSETAMKQLSAYFDYAGLNEPFSKVYVSSRNNMDYAITIFIFVLAHIKLMFLPQNIGSLSKKAYDQMDGVALSVAVHTILKQVHSDINRDFIKLITGYILQLTKYTGIKSPEILPEVVVMLNFMDFYTDYSESSRIFYRQNLPEEILLLQQSLITGT
ncbi:WASH complex subunit 5 isoform X1 [Euwallacea similis]|uniref:WASH complex subunit 5 isoform X1 n=3 Tax=Euwallacea similis TaxID=1736056 RepID=UPI00344B0F03